MSKRAHQKRASAVRLQVEPLVALGPACCSSHARPLTHTHTLALPQRPPVCPLARFVVVVAAAVAPWSRLPRRANTHARRLSCSVGRRLPLATTRRCGQSSSSPSPDRAPARLDCRRLGGRRFGDSAGVPRHNGRRARARAGALRISPFPARSRLDSNLSRHRRNNFAPLTHTHTILHASADVWQLRFSPSCGD